MYRHAVAAFTATTAVLLAGAGVANAETETAADTAPCRNYDGISIYVSPPPRVAGSVTADDIRGLMDSLVAGTSLERFFSPPLSQPSVSGFLAPYSAAGRYAAPSPAPSPAPSLSPSITSGPVTPTPVTPTPVAPSPVTPAPASPSPATPSPSASSPSTTGLSAADAADVSRVSPARLMLEDLVGKALECIRITASPGTVVRSTSVLDASSVAKLTDALIIRHRAACAPSTSPSAAPPSPATLLGALGVPQLLDALVAHPATCAYTAPYTAPAGALLDSLGVTDLLHDLAGD
ncbi:hypothetical protein [Nonomuraea sp. NPDC049709]|uniref:hypothetical protein n=1 Tax=Nonomuraea sp. NPDC049709 TaxID=3154736 RepID=UPI00343C29C0